MIRQAPYPSQRHIRVDPSDHRIDSEIMSDPSLVPFHDRFWQALDDLVQSKTVMIDRPAGSKHPRYPDLVYPLDYGYLDGTQAMDGGGIDVWVGSLGQGLVTGVVATVALCKRDGELKILIGCFQEEMLIIEAHHNGQSQSGLLVVRETR
jgi:inorganic pyrophosphatase